MKSDVIHISNDGNGIAEALKQTEAVAIFKSLSKKDSIHLLLLTEEMTGMLKSLTGNHDADFWIEDSENTFYLHLKTEAAMNTDMRKKLLSASTSGENIAVHGVMGRIKDIFTRLLEPTDAPMPKEYAAGFAGSNLDTMGAASVAKNMSIAAANVWSLSRYKNMMTAEDEVLNEIEQSIVANIADEIEIGISDNCVEMVVHKCFSEKE